jgi:hypothetical protein
LRGSGPWQLVGIVSRDARDHALANTSSSRRRAREEALERAGAYDKDALPRVSGLALHSDGPDIECLGSLATGADLELDLFAIIQ